MFLTTPAKTGCFSAWFRQILPPLLALILASIAPPGFSQNPLPPAPSAEAEELTHALATLNARYQQGRPAERPGLLDDVIGAAAQRHQILTALIEENPGEVLRLALPDSVRAGMPAAVQEFLEQRQELEGEIEVLHVDYKDAKQSHYVYLLKMEFGERFSLHFAHHPPGLLSGTHVRVHGLMLHDVKARDAGGTDGAVAVEDGTTSVETLEAGGISGTDGTTAALTTVLPNTFGAQKTLVLLVNFQDKQTQPYTPDFARNVIFNTTSNFDRENSFQQTWLTGYVFGWYTIPLDSTVCDASKLATYAQQAATAAGVDLSAYSRYVYAFPNNVCGWWGLGSVGGNPSHAWINGSLALKVVGHEMGHNFGLYHAHSLECGTSTLGSSCTTNEYGDGIDMMGGSAAGHFNAFEKERLGWLDYAASPPMVTVQADGAYWLDPYETDGGVNPKALKILKSVDPATGAKTWYYVEYRQAIGFDGFLSGNSNVLNGVVVHTGAETGGNTNYLLDMTPTSPSSFGYPALGVGQSFHDPEAGVTIAPTWANSTTAAVTVSFGPLACVPANPTVALSPSQSQWVPAGTPVTYNVSVTNRDNTGCGASGFNLGASVLNGWTAGFANPVLTLDPGAGGSTTLTVTSPLTAADGFYNVPVTATDSADASHTAATSATVVIASELGVNVSADKASYARNQWVTLTASVQANGMPASGAGVTFTVTKSNLSKVTQTAAADASGVAVFKFRLNRKDPVGVYQTRADANLNNTIFGSAVGSFSVQ